MRKKVANICFQNDHQKFVYWRTEKIKKKSHKYDPKVYLLFFFPSKKRAQDIPI